MPQRILSPASTRNPLIVVNKKNEATHGEIVQEAMARAYLGCNPQLNAYHPPPSAQPTIWISYTMAASMCGGRTLKQPGGGFRCGLLLHLSFFLSFSFTRLVQWASPQEISRRLIPVALASNMHLQLVMEFEKQ